MMACPKQEKNYIRTVLKDTIKMLIKYGLTYKSKFNVEGLLGITVDDGEVFLISVNELVVDDVSPTVDSDVEFVDRKVDVHSYSPIRIRPGQGSRKRRHIHTSDGDKNELSSAEESADSFSPNRRQLDSGPAANELTSSETLLNTPTNVDIKTELEASSWQPKTNKQEINHNESPELDSSSFYNQSPAMLNSGSALTLSNTNYDPMEFCVTNKTKGGRPMDVVWDYYNRLDQNGRLQALCKTCGNRVSAKAGRLREHLRKCGGITLQPPKSQHSILMDVAMECSQRRQQPLLVATEASRAEQAPLAHSYTVFPENKPSFRASADGSSPVEKPFDQEVTGRCHGDGNKHRPSDEARNRTVLDKYANDSAQNNDRVTNDIGMCSDVNGYDDSKRIKQERSTQPDASELTAPQSNCENGTLR